MRNIIKSGLLLLACLFLGGHAAGAATAVTLPIGASRVISLSAPITRIVIGEPGIIEATVLNDRQVQIVALKPGRTAMTLFAAGTPEGDSYAVQVGDPPRAPVATGGGGSNPGQGMRGDPELAGIRVTGGDTPVISGTAGNVAAHARAVSAAGGPAVVDASRVNGNQMVAVEIRFAAVSVTTMQALGFNFQSLGHGIQGALTAPSTVGGFAMVPKTGLNLATSLPIQSAFNLFLASPQSSALAMVSALSGAGLMQLLAEPTLLVRSGSNANFLAGGDIPIPVPQGGGNGNAITIEYRPYGVRLEVSPVVLSDRRILLRVSPEVSEIDNTNAVSFQGFQVPAFRRRSTSTTVELADGQGFMIAGLIYGNDTFTESKVPFLGDLPILGNFFKLTQNSRERQELIIIATPRLVNPMDPKSIPPLPGIATANYNPTFGDLLLNRKPLDQAVRDYGLSR